MPSSSPREILRRVNPRVAPMRDSESSLSDPFDLEMYYIERDTQQLGTKFMH